MEEQLREHQGATEGWDYPCTVTWPGYMISSHISSESGIRITNVSIPVQGASIKARTYVPEPNEDESLFPILVRSMEADSGWETCSLILWWDPAPHLQNKPRLLYKQHPFPIPMQDSYDALKWIATNTSSFSGDPTKGLTAGGNFAAVVLALRARDDPSLKGKLTGQVLQVPILCSTLFFQRNKWRNRKISTIVHVLALPR
ncbi:hypothetical protein K439DRAFT_1617830 [Ramaria rubella]|nr:hypothetical protein K439DRAFT_1617830 [Ramaria rubella]